MAETSDVERVSERRRRGQSDVIAAGASARASQRVRVMVSDCERIVCEGLGALLATQAGIDVVATALPGDEAVAVVAAHAPHVVVMSLAAGSGRFGATRQIAALAPAPRVVVLTTFAAREDITGAFDAGASACVSRAEPSSELPNAIRAVHKGELYTSPLVRELLLRGRTTAGVSEAGAARRLTEREREVLNLIVAGETDRRVASILGLSIKTVHTHRMHIMAKLGVHNSTTLTRRAMQLGLVNV